MEGQSDRYAEERKKAPLTNREFLIFFFFPFNNEPALFNTNALNDEEDERFTKYGFDTKLKQARSARKFGRAFYVFTTILLVIFL